MLIRLMLGAMQFQGSFSEMQDLFNTLSRRQNPNYLIFACSDSRVDPPLITQSEPGVIFSSRSIGNTIPPYSTQEKSTAAVIEYSLTNLPIKDVIVCSHSDCGAMKGLLTPGTEDRLPNTFAWLKLGNSDSVVADMKKERKHTGHLDTDAVEAAKRNALLQLENLKTYPWVAEKLKRKELNLHAWYFDIKTASVSIYSEQHKDFISLEKAFQLALEERRKRIVSEVAMNYLAQFSNPLTAKDYQYATRVFSLLASDLRPIWPQIKVQISLELWKELGELYKDPLDPQFTNLVEQGCKLRLENLKDFQKK